MSKLSDTNEVGRISADDPIREDPYNQERLIEAWKTVNKTKTAKIEITIDGQSLYRNYALNDSGEVPDSALIGLQEMADKLTDYKLEF